MNEKAGYVVIETTDAVIKATWKNLSTRVKGLLGRKKVADSKQRWPPLLDPQSGEPREVSSDTEPDADFIPRYYVQEEAGPLIEVEWVRPIL